LGTTFGISTIALLLLVLVLVLVDRYRTCAYSIGR
jgi:hypothetical protein